MPEFKIGQYVYYLPHKAEGRYVVMRLLPRGTKAGLQYIIRSQADPEREYIRGKRTAQGPGWALKNSPRIELTGPRSEG